MELNIAGSFIYIDLKSYLLGFLNENFINIFIPASLIGTITDFIFLDIRQLSQLITKNFVNILFIDILI